MPLVFQVDVSLSLPSNKVIAQGPLSFFFPMLLSLIIFALLKLQTLFFLIVFLFLFSSFRRLACLLLVQFSPPKISPYFCGNTGELRVLTGTFKSMQFKNCQTEGDLETEGTSVSIFQHAFKKNLSQEHPQANTYFSFHLPGKADLIFCESNIYRQTETTIFFINDCKVVV